MIRQLVSVVICTYNGGDYLLPSIQSILDQTYKNLEILVVDDGSTDNSVELAKTHINDRRIRWFHQENAGKATALNLALKNIRGTYYAIQDADDISHPRRIERLIECMTKYPSLAGVYSGYELIINNRHLAPISICKSVEQCKRDIDNLLMPSHDPTGLYRVSTVKDILYETSLRIAQGYDYILRVGEQLPLMVIGDCLYSYRIHWRSITRTDASLRQKYVQEVWQRAARRRGIDFVSLSEKKIISKKGSSTSTSDNGIANHFINSVLSQRKTGDRLAALRNGLFCSTLHPFDLHYQKALACSLLPERLMSLIRHN